MAVEFGCVGLRIGAVWSGPFSFGMADKVWIGQEWRGVVRLRLVWQLR